MKLTVGKQAPDFTLLDQQGKSHTLSSYRGTWILLYFYPKDDTPGCTKEACQVRDHLPQFKKQNLRVFGISVDSIKRHIAFAKKYALTFPLLSDEKKEVVKTYGVWAKKKFMGREYQGTLRTSFLIDPKGMIAKIYDKVKPDSHAMEVLQDVP